MRHPIRLTAAIVLACAAFAPSSGLAGASSLRLARDVVPTAQTVMLRLDAAKPDYSGSVRISLRVNAQADSFQLNARGIRIEKAALSGERGAVAVTHAEAPQERVTFRAARPLSPGRYTLDIDFTNAFNTKAVSLYRLDTGGNAYSFTQFEANDARGAIPCWDEPEFKIPWRVTLVVPEGHLAVSNTPIAKEAVAAGQRTVEFLETKPLPSYLLAIATGPLETVSIPGMSVPGRIVGVKGTTSLAGEAVKMAPPLLAALEKYFGRPYPYEKLDLIAVPEFWPGAMENAGAITYADRILLLDPAAISVQQRRRLATVTAHEMAHMWFGDLVTMKWWDDLWLNESFASWLGDKITHQVYPEFNLPVRELEGTETALVPDARLSTRAIREPITNVNLGQMADRLAYDKGQSVLGMFEQWLGAETFRQGVVGYVNAHAWGNAEAADLWTDLSRAGKRDVGSAMSTFLDQPGVPLVSVEPLAGGKVRLRQGRFLSSGATPPPALWKIPVTLKFSDGEKVYSQNVMLSEASQTLSLSPAVKAVWIHPNGDERGYYRWVVPSKELHDLAAAAPGALNPRERVGFIGNLTALLFAGTIHGDDYLRVLARFGDDPEPDVVAAVTNALEQLKRPFATPEIETAFASYVRKTLGPALKRLGPTPRDGEAAVATSLRPQLMTALGEDGHDLEVLERARSMAESFLSNPASVDPSLVDAAVMLSALGGDAARYDDYRTRFESAKTPVERNRFLTALGYFRDSALVERTLRYAIEGPLRPQELRMLLRGLGSSPALESRIYTWMERNYKAITAKMPSPITAFMPNYAGGCSAQRLEAARVFFAEPEHRVPGTEKALAKVADQITDCVGLREREGAAVTKYLSEIAASR